MLRDENTQILHLLQTSLTKTSLIRLSLYSLTSLDETGKSPQLPFHQLLVYGAHVLHQFCQFWTELQSKLYQQGPYQQTNIGGLRLRLSKLQVEDQEVWKIIQQYPNKGWKKKCGWNTIPLGLTYFFNRRSSK